MEQKQRRTKICMIADGHGLYDDRLYWKEALSFVRAGYEVSIIVTGTHDEQGVTDEGIPYHIVKIERYFKQKVLNFIAQRIRHKTNHKILNIARREQADIYNLHDYQQLPIVKQLKELPQQPKLVYDARIPLFDNLYHLSQVRGIKKTLVKLHALYWQRLEYRIVKYIDVIITVDDGVYNSFKARSQYNRLEVVYNYTSLMKDRAFIPVEQRAYDVIHCGGITKARGFYMLLEVGKLLAQEGKKLLLLGKIFEPELNRDFNRFIREHALEDYIIRKDHVRFDRVSDYYNNSKIGLNIMPYNKAHEHIIQIKLFEFMNFGIPIVTSNYGEMQAYVRGNEVGLTVDPKDARAVVEAVKELLNDKQLYESCSRHGIAAVDNKYHWSLMEEKLLNIYEGLYTED